LFKHKLSHFEQDIITIHPGEYYISDVDVVIATVLGSCISVSLWDQKLKQGGINHFMLPGDLDNPDVVLSHNAKYGMFAMELLYNELFKKHSRKQDIVAKVFGGASVLRLANGSSRIPKANIDFAMAYLETERIPVVANDTGGILPRKIFFFAKTGKVLLKRMSGTMASTVEREEEAYLDKILRLESGNVTIFNK